MDNFMVEKQIRKEIDKSIDIIFDEFKTFKVIDTNFENALCDYYKINDKLKMKNKLEDECYSIVNETINNTSIKFNNTPQKIIYNVCYKYLFHLAAKLIMPSIFNKLIYKYNIRGKNNEFIINSKYGTDNLNDAIQCIMQDVLKILYEHLDINKSKKIDFLYTYISNSCRYYLLNVLKIKKVDKLTNFIYEYSNNMKNDTDVLVEDIIIEKEMDNFFSNKNNIIELYNYLNEEVFYLEAGYKHSKYLYYYIQYYSYLFLIDKRNILNKKQDKEIKKITPIRVMPKIVKHHKVKLEHSRLNDYRKYLWKRLNVCISKWINEHFGEEINNNTCLKIINNFHYYLKSILIDNKKISDKIVEYNSIIPNRIVYLTEIL